MKLRNSILSRLNIFILVLVIAAQAVGFFAFSREAKAACDISIGSVWDSPRGQVLGSQVIVNKDTIGLQEEFEVYMEVSIDPQLALECTSSSYTFAASMYYSLASNATKKDFPAKLVTDAQGVSKFAAKVKLSAAEMKLTGQEVSLNCPTCPKIDVPGYYIYGYFKTASGSYGSGLGPKTSFAPYVKLDRTGNNHPVTTVLPADIDTTTKPIDYGKDGILYDKIKFTVGVTTPGLDAGQYRHFYRITFDKGGWIAVSSNGAAATAGVGPTTYLDEEKAKSYLKQLLIDPWRVKTVYAQSNSNSNTNTTTNTTTSGSYNTSLIELSKVKLAVNMSMAEPAGITWGGSDPTVINYSQVSKDYGTIGTVGGGKQYVKDLSVIGVEESKSKDPSICGPLKYNEQQIACNSNEIAKLPAPVGVTSLEKNKVDFTFPDLSKSSLTTIGVKESSGTTPVLSKVVFYPTLRLRTSLISVLSPIAIKSNLSNIYGFSYSQNTQSVYFEVYSTKEELEKHKNDAPPSSVSTYQEATTSSATKASGDSMLDFIFKAISYLLLIQNLIIFYVFSYIVAPFLVAVLKIQAYKDDFVNVIYPGWLILRNLSNILFIVALLVIGLGTMFQVKTYQARNMIVKLILMALLLNFSLVLAQGVVGIADTVQSQFLPDDQNIVNALANQLMVEPLRILRDAEGGSYSTTTEFSEIGKAFVLSFFAMCALFAFIVVLAFLVVRLVMLWILYLTSPIAYVGQILPMSQKWASKWWSEFLKYAFVGPVLAFFLNIAALFATGNFFQKADFGSGEGFAAGSVNLVLLAAQNLVIMAFMIFGLKTAATSGVVGAKAITDFAEKGVKWPYKAAKNAAGGALGVASSLKDTAADMAAEKAKDSKRPGLAKAITAIAKPWETTKAAKKGFWDNPKEKRDKRLQGTIGEMGDFGAKVGNNKWLTAKMMAYKAWGTSGNDLLDHAKDLDEKAGIMDDTAKVDRLAETAKATADQTTKQSRYSELKSGFMSVPELRSHYKEMEDKMDDIAQKKQDMVDDLTDKRDAALALGTIAGGKQAAKLDKEIVDKSAEYDKQYKDVQAMRKRVEDKIDDAVKKGQTEVMMDPALTTDLKVVFDADAVKETLEKEINDLGKQIHDNNESIKKDDELRAKHKVTYMDPAVRASIQAEAEALRDKADNRFYKESASDLAERNKRESEALKPYEEMETYEEMGIVLKKALSENNIDLASAMSKKIAKAGLFDKLLEDEQILGKKYQNSIEGLHQFMNEKFGKVPPQARLKMESVISVHNEKNGNAALGKAVTITEKGTLRQTTLPQQQDKLENSLKKKNVWDLKKGDITYKDASGKPVFNKGIIENLQGLNDNKLTEMKKRMHADIAKHILETDTSGNITGELKIALQNTAGKTKP